MNKRKKDSKSTRKSRTNKQCYFLPNCVLYSADIFGNLGSQTTHIDRIEIRDFLFQQSRVV